MTMESGGVFRVHGTHTSDPVIITVSGELYAEATLVLNEHLDQVAGDLGVIVLDMANVTFFGSAGLASLLVVIQRGFDIYLVGSRQVVRTVELCGIDDRVKLFRSVEDATESAVQRT